MQKAESVLIYEIVPVPFSHLYSSGICVSFNGIADAMIYSNDVITFYMRFCQIIIIEIIITTVVMYIFHIDLCFKFSIIQIYIPKTIGFCSMQSITQTSYAREQTHELT